AGGGQPAGLQLLRARVLAPARERGAHVPAEAAGPAGVRGRGRGAGLVPAQLGALHLQGALRGRPRADGGGAAGAGERGGGGAHEPGAAGAAEPPGGPGPAVRVRHGAVGVLRRGRVPGPGAVRTQGEDGEVKGRNPPGRLRLPPGGCCELPAGPRAGHHSGGGHNKPGAVSRGLVHEEGPPLCWASPPGVCANQQRGCVLLRRPCPTDGVAGRRVYYYWRPLPPVCSKQAVFLLLLLMCFFFCTSFFLLFFFFALCPHNHTVSCDAQLVTNGLG
ncbi:unnamed protein product, partial [Heterosigma akashiwo]